MTQALWPIFLYFLFKFIMGYLGVQPPYRGPDPAQPRLFYLFRIHLGKPKGLHPTFSNTRHSHRISTDFFFLHRISCMRESLLFSSCAACTAGRHAQLGALPTFWNVSCSVYLWTEHTYQLVPPDTAPLAGPILFTDFPFCLFPFFNLISYFGLKSA